VNKRRRAAAEAAEVEAEAASRAEKTARAKAAEIVREREIDAVAAELTGAES